MIAGVFVNTGYRTAVGKFNTPRLEIADDAVDARQSRARPAQGALRGVSDTPLTA